MVNYNSLSMSAFAACLMGSLIILLCFRGLIKRMMKDAMTICTRKEGFKQVRNMLLPI